VKKDKEKKKGYTISCLPPSHLVLGVKRQRGADGLGQWSIILEGPFETLRWAFSRCGALPDNPGHGEKFTSTPRRGDKEIVRRAWIFQDPRVDVHGFGPC